MKLLSEEILKIRKEHKLTQQELAERLYVTRQAVSKWECDKAFPGEDVIEKIKEEFNVDLNLLISEEQIKSTINTNNSEIKKIKKVNKFTLLSIIVMFVTMIIALIIICIPPNKPLKKIEVEMYEDIYYCEWNEIEDANYYFIYIDGKYQWTAFQYNRYIFNETDINGDFGTMHTIRVEAYMSENKKIGISENVVFTKVKKGKEYTDIIDISKNTYFANSSGTGTVTFNTNLSGLFKINLYYDDIIMPITDYEIVNNNPTKDHYFYQYKDSYYLVISQPLVSNVTDEDGDLLTPNEVLYKMEINLGLPNGYKKFKIEFIHNKININSLNSEYSIKFDTLKQGEVIGDKWNSSPIINTMYELNTSFDISEKILYVKYIDTKVTGLNILIFDEKCDLIGLSVEAVNNNEYEITIPSLENKKLYVCIEIICEYVTLNDCDFIFKIK